MEKELDELLRHALTPTQQPDFRLNRKILNQAKELRDMRKKAMRRLPAAVLTAALILGAGSLTAFAAWRYLTPEDVAQEMNDTKLAEAFLGGEAVMVNETQSHGGYDVTLLGIVSGENLSKYSETMSDKTYAVVAIAKSDGTPVVQEEEAFFVSPLISGYDPVHYNAASMHGSYTEMTEAGVLYRLVECDTVEILADHDLYLCISDGDFYNAKAYCYHEETGVISRNPEYDGVNALFDLALDTEKADPERAAEYMADIWTDDSGISREKLNVELDESFAVPTASGNEPGTQAAEYALQFVGNPYAWGGDSLTEGTDSSGFTSGVYAYFDVSLPHDSKEQRQQGYEIEGLENALPGDLIFYETPAHVAIYIGDGKIVHALSLAGEICVSEADFDEIVMIRRVWEEK